eukprot:COSAG02_NODE_21796_length_774_cov_4.531852_1_plen_33_part_10
MGRDSVLASARTLLHRREEAQARRGAEDRHAYR